MRKYLEKLQAYAASSDRGKDAPETILEMLYDAYGEYHNTEDEGIRMAFQQLYGAMHGKSLMEQDEIIYAVCTLCRDHEKAGFIEGIKVGMSLAKELNIA